MSCCSHSTYPSPHAAHAPHAPHVAHILLTLNLMLLTHLMHLMLLIFYSPFTSTFYTLNVIPWKCHAAHILLTLHLMLLMDLMHLMLLIFYLPVTSCCSCTSCCLSSTCPSPPPSLVFPVLAIWRLHVQSGRVFTRGFGWDFGFLFNGAFLRSLRGCGKTL